MSLDLYSFENLWRHYRKCRSNKRNTLNALRFEIDAEANLLRLQRELRSHTYRPGRSICFVTDGPKPREVFAADFRDRVVHHVLVSAQERVFEPRFIHDSYACRVGKGTLAASDRLMAFLRSATANGRRPAWALKLDVASFFPSIHKPTLDAIIARHIRDPEILWLTRVLLFHDPTADYHFQGIGRGIGPPGSPSYPIPAGKSLFGGDGERGLPIGNLTSQFWANVYLNELDQFVKRRLGCRFYVRYVDDMILLDATAERLTTWLIEIKRFLDQHLRLHLRADTRPPFPVRQGVEFVGWRTWFSHRVPRRQTTGRLRRAVGRFERREVGLVWGGAVLRLDLTPRPRRKRESAADLRVTLASYAGHLRHGAAWREWVMIWSGRTWLDALFRRDGWWLGPRWPAPQTAAMPLRVAYLRLIRGAGEEALVFVRCGRYVEFYGPQRLRAQATLALRPIVLPRAGYSLTAGFPVWLADHFLRRALEAGLTVVFAAGGASGLGAGAVFVRSCPSRGGLQSEIASILPSPSAWGHLPARLRFRVARPHEGPTWWSSRRRFRAHLHVASGAPVEIAGILRSPLVRPSSCW